MFSSFLSYWLDILFWSFYHAVSSTLPGISGPSVTDYWTLVWCKDHSHCTHQQEEFQQNPEKSCLERVRIGLPCVYALYELHAVASFCSFFTCQGQLPHLLWASQQPLPPKNSYNILRSITLTLAFALYHCEWLEAPLPHVTSANLGCQQSEKQPDHPSQRSNMQLITSLSFTMTGWQLDVAATFST